MWLPLVINGRVTDATCAKTSVIEMVTLWDPNPILRGTSTVNDRAWEFEPVQMREEHEIKTTASLNLWMWQKSMNISPHNTVVEQAFRFFLKVLCIHNYEVYLCTQSEFRMDHIWLKWDSGYCCYGNKSPLLPLVTGCTSNLMQICRVWVMNSKTGPSGYLAPS